MQEDIIICPNPECRAKIDVDDYFNDYLYEDNYTYDFKVYCHRCTTEIIVKRDITVSYHIVED